MPCLVVFLGYVACMVGISIYAFQTGQPQKLTHGFDYKGQLCGVDKAVEDEPMLFWCPKGNKTLHGHPADLDVKHPICMAECPSQELLSVHCFDNPKAHVKDLGGSFPDEQITIQTRTVRKHTYPSQAFAGMFCVPRFHEKQGHILGDEPLVQELLDSHGPIGNGYFRTAAALGSLRRSWQSVVIAVLLSVVFSYTYLFALRCAPYGTSIASIVIVMVASLTLGIYFLLASKLSGSWLTHYQNTNSLYKIFDTEYAQWVSWVLGMLLLFAFGFMACGLAAIRQSIKQATGCVRVAAECVFSMPTMMLTPCFEAIFKLVLWFALLSSLMWLLATAEVVPTSLDEVGNFVYGTARRVVFTVDQQAMLAFYLVGIVWFIELSKNFATFVVTYAVFLWYYTPKPKGCGPSFPLLQGVGAGLFYHLGTIALGSFLIATTRPFRLTFLWLSRQAKGEGNAIVAAVASCCGACISFTHRNLEFMTKGAFMDVALSGTPFMVAAQNAHGFVSADVGKIAELTGAVGIISFAVVSTVFTLTLLAIWGFLMLRLRQVTPDQPREHIENPYFVALLAGTLAASLAGSFMVIFEQCSDSLLYIFRWNKAHGHNTVAKYCPDELAKLMEYKKVFAGDGMRNRPEPPGIFSTLLSSSA